MLGVNRITVNLFSMAQENDTTDRNRGQADGRIAQRLGVSVRTANHHVSAILRKLNVANRTCAVVVAERLRTAQSL